MYNCMYGSQPNVGLDQTSASAYAYGTSPTKLQL